MSLPRHVIEIIDKCKSNYLNLEASGISDQNVPEVCTMLTNLRHIDALAIGENGIHNAGTILLAQLLPPHIHYLDITRTGISNESVNALLSNRNLTKLILARNNGLTDAIADSIEKADHITFINLEYIHISPPAIERIKKKVEQNNALLEKYHITENQESKQTKKPCVIYSEPGYSNKRVNLSKFYPFMNPNQLAKAKKDYDGEENALQSSGKKIPGKK